MKTNHLILAGLLAMGAVSVVCAQSAGPEPGTTPGVMPKATQNVPAGQEQPGATQPAAENYVGYGGGGGGTGFSGGVVGQNNFGVGSYRIWSAAGREEGPVSTLFFKNAGQKTIDETAEDLRIMSLLLSQDLDRALSDGGPDYKLGIPLLLRTEGRSVEASYVEGFGAIFNVKVRFPLTPPRGADKASQPNPRASAWDRARRELAGTPETAPQGLFGSGDWSESRPYQPGLVEALKKQALETLENSSNLRHVAAGEWIVVTITGSPTAQENQGAGSTVNPAAGQAPSAGLGGPVPQTTTLGRPIGAQNLIVFGSSGGPPERATVMTIRVKKEDADAVAAGKMTAEEFFKTAEVSTYLGPSATVATFETQ